MAETDSPAVNLRKAARDLNQIQRRFMWAGFDFQASRVVETKTDCLEAAEALEAGLPVFEVKWIVDRLPSHVRELIGGYLDVDPGTAVTAAMALELLIARGVTLEQWQAWRAAMMEGGGARGQCTGSDPAKVGG